MNPRRQLPGPEEVTPLALGQTACAEVKNSGEKVPAADPSESKPATHGRRIPVSIIWRMRDYERRFDQFCTATCRGRGFEESSRCQKERPSAKFGHAGFVASGLSTTGCCPSLFVTPLKTHIKLPDLPDARPERSGPPVFPA